MNEELYRVVDYILNTAQDPELEVVEAALKKRMTEQRGRTIMGIDPGKMAAESSGRLQQQLEISKHAVAKMAADFAADIIRKNAPELNEEQVRELMEGLMPEIAGGKPSKRKSGGDSGSGLPSSMIIQMVQQFIEYSEGTMSAAEQIRMEEEIPGWKEKYWHSFPGQVQKLVSLYLNGDIDRQRFEAHLYEVLGL